MNILSVDDSGWGCLLGGVMIGMYNSGTNKFLARLIPIKYFQGDMFQKKRYKVRTQRIFWNNWNKLGPVDQIQICRGPIFNGLRIELQYHLVGVPVMFSEVVDPLQGWLEEKFAKHLVKLGVPRLTNGAHCLTFEDQVKWATESKERTKYVKTGWDSWKHNYTNLL